MTATITGTGLGILQAGSGNCDDNERALFNTIKISSDSIRSDLNGEGYFDFVEGVQLVHEYGGSTMTGGRNSLAVYSYLVSPTSPDNNNRNYCGLVGIAVAASGDGGTSATLSGSKGAVFGIGGVGTAFAGGTNLHNVTAAELNTAMHVGSSAYAKSLLQISGRGDDKVAGSGVNSMIWAYNQETAVKWDNFLHLDGQTHDWPLVSGGNIIKATGPTTTVTLRDDGRLAGLGYIIGGDPNGTFSLGSTTGSPVPYFDFNAGKHSDYDVRIQAIGGSVGTAGKGTLRMEAGHFVLKSLPVHSNNASAIAGGVPVDGLYRTSGGALMVRY